MPPTIPDSTPMAMAPQPGLPPARVDEYELVRPLGHGAMGQVYQAWDTVLSRPVAIKFLATESPTEQERERLLIEARAIARVQNPNILSIYRVGVVNGRPYLAAEFLSGRSLDKVPLPLPWKRALDLAVQLARGLSVAHRQGVLHRDLKPANVILTEDGTAKLLDFGLAKLDENRPLADLSAEKVRVAMFQPSEDQACPPSAIAQTMEAAADAPPGDAAAQSAPARRPTWNSVGLAIPAGAASGAGLEAFRASPQLTEPSLTAAGAILDTPFYMAPEAWRGEPASAATDVYSFGAMLYELCTARPPHDYKTHMEIASAAIAHDARPLADIVPGISQRFAAIIDRCLKREPACRFASGEELLQSLEKLHSELAMPTTRAMLQAAIRRRWLLTLLLAAALLVPPLVAIGYLYNERAERQRVAALLKHRRSVAIIGMTNRARSAPVSGFAAAFADLLGAELTAGERLLRIPQDSVTRMKIELELPDATSYPEALLADIRRHLNADLLVTGEVVSTAAQGERLRIQMAVTDSRTGMQLAAAVVIGLPGELFELVARMGSELRQQLGLGRLSAAQTAALRAVRPLSPQVAQNYAQGRDLLRRFDAIGARRHLEQVIAADPTYPLGHLAMSEVWTALGYDEKAKEEARRAFEMSGHLAREDRYLIEARYREASKSWDQAAAAYRTLLTFFPDSLEYGLYLANAELAGGQPKASLATVQRLRSLHSRAEQDPRLDIIEGKALMDAGELDAAYARLERAASLGQKISAPLLVARARLEAAYALQYVGHYQRSVQHAALASELFTAAGDRSAAADALLAMGSAYMSQGDLAQSLRAAQQALDLLLSIKNSALIAATMCNMSLISIKNGQLELARAQAQGGLALAREIGIPEAIGAGLVALGWLNLLSGDVAGSLRWLQEGSDVIHENGDPRMIAWVQGHLGQLLLAQGKLGEAERRLRDALAIQEQHDLKGFAAESRAALAAVSLERHEAQPAEALARAAAKQFAEEKQADNEAWAQSLLAEALSGQGKDDEAERAIRRARELAAGGQSPMVQLLVKRKSLQAQLSRHPAASEQKQLEQELATALENARSAGLRIEELELRLMQQTLLYEQNPSAETRTRIQELAKEAATQGLFLIAKKADNFMHR